jgi:hypothetical protein
MTSSQSDGPVAGRQLSLAGQVIADLQAERAQILRLLLRLHDGV